MNQFSREYRGMKEANRDMSRLGRQGFEVVSTHEVSQRIGLGRFLLIGWFSLIFRPKAHVAVTYRGEGKPTPQPMHFGLVGWAFLAPLWVWTWRMTLASSAWSYRWTRDTLVPWLRDVAIPWIVSASRRMSAWLTAVAVPAIRAKISVAHTKLLPPPTSSATTIPNSETQNE